MISFIITIIKLLLILCVVASIHEFGHFLAAKLLKVGVNEFSIGFGPKIIQKKIKETMYSIRCLPLGGYVSIEGEEGESDSQNSFSKKNSFEKIIILSMGVIFNAILAIIIFLGVAFSRDMYNTKIVNIVGNSPLANAGIQMGDTILELNGNKVKIQSDLTDSKDKYPDTIEIKYLRNGVVNTATVSDVIKEKGYIGTAFKVADDGTYVTNEVEVVAAGGVAAKSKLKSGDKIEKIDGIDTPTSTEVVTTVEKSAGKEITLEINRNGEIITKILTPEIKNSFYLGVGETEKVSPNISLAIASAGSNIKNIVGSYVDLFKGKVGVKDMSGIVGIGEVVSKTNGFINFLNLMGIISLAVGIANIMPFPPLDGGKIVIVLVEAITRKKISEKVELTISYIGLALLIGLTLFVTYNDILRII